MISVGECHPIQVIRLPAITLVTIGAGSRTAASLRQIAEALNAPGISAPRGGQWHATSIRNVMARAELQAGPFDHAGSARVGPLFRK
jgi:hypothetical protein